MTTKLGLYNNALGNIKERSLATLTDNTPARYELDRVYDGAVQYVLEAGLWSFAKRTIALEPESQEPAFGWAYLYERPSDYVRLVAISDVADLWPSLDRYDVDGAYWYADCDPLYVAYVSNDTSYGLDMSRWPQTFVTALEWYLASRVAPTISSTPVDMRPYRDAIKDAKSKDMMGQARIELPPGRLVRSRRGRTGVDDSWRR